MKAILSEKKPVSNPVLEVGKLYQYPAQSKNPTMVVACQKVYNIYNFQGLVLYSVTPGRNLLESCSDFCPSLFSEYDGIVTLSND